MSGAGSAWKQLAWRKNNRLGLPDLEGIVMPRRAMLRKVLSEKLTWLVGPPKIGKTVLANYLSYFHVIGRTAEVKGDPIIGFEGVADCVRGLDLLLEGPMQSSVVLILENPLGVTEPHLDSMFIDRLDALRTARPDLNIILTSRPRPYLEMESLLSMRGLATATPATFQEWYDPEDLLLHFQSTTVDLTLELAQRLACPALVLQYRDYGVLPGSLGQRSATRSRYESAEDDVTLDKLGLLESDEELAMLAMVLRLQEYAFSLPTAEEVATLIDTPFLQSRRAGLVASPFDFDGERRLTFEHATTREATDLLLKREMAEQLPRLGRLLASGRSRWLKRSIELWETEQLAAAGDWSALEEKDEEVIAGVAAQMLAVSDGADAAISRIQDLDLDLWTAQDVAYELALRWSRYAMSGAARALVARIASDRAALGAYAILEALLYVRGREVADLWRWVDSAYDEFVSAGPPWARELVLAMDALAWRPPPEWHVHNGWVRRFLDSLEPADDAWALIRFLRGYHAEGLEYLGNLSPRFRASLRRDEDINWTKGQIEIGVWLVQWHFVHQCRARAQLAHQPWVTQEYLARSYYPAVIEPDRDRRVANLIQSVGAASQNAGWGFFLGENVRAVDPGGFGDQALAAARKSLGTAGSNDTGIIAAVLTYTPDERLLSLVRQHFADPTAQDALFSAMVDGLVVDGVRLVEPRFSFRRSLASVYRSCGIEWPKLKAALPVQDLFDANHEFDVDGLVRRIEDVGSRHPFSTDPSLVGFADLLLHRVRNGDLRMLDRLEHRSLPRGSPEDPYAVIFESAVARLAQAASESEHG